MGLDTIAIRGGLGLLFLAVFVSLVVLDILLIKYWMIRRRKVKARQARAELRRQQQDLVRRQDECRTINIQELIK